MRDETQKTRIFRSILILKNIRNYIRDYVRNRILKLIIMKINHYFAKNLWIGFEYNRIFLAENSMLKIFPKWIHSFNCCIFSERISQLFFIFWCCNSFFGIKEYCLINIYNTYQWNSNRTRKCKRLLGIFALRACRENFRSNKFLKYYYYYNWKFCYRIH
jgi:hypothetical protein